MIYLFCCFISFIFLCIYLFKLIFCKNKKTISKNEEIHNTKEDYEFEDYGFAFYSKSKNSIEKKENLKEENYNIESLICSIKELINTSFHSDLVKDKILSEISFLENNLKNNEEQVFNSLNLIKLELEENIINDKTTLINNSTSNILKTIKIIKESKL